MPASRIDQINIIKRRLGTKSSGRVLSAMGHPGYSEAYAVTVLSIWVEDVSKSLHAAVYGGVA